MEYAELVLDYQIWLMKILYCHSPIPLRSKNQEAKGRFEKFFGIAAIVGSSSNY